MKLSSTTKTISVGKTARQIFEDLDKIRPNYISFSLQIALACEEYVKNHSKKNGNITDFTSSEVVSSLPIFFAEMSTWKTSIEKMSDEDFVKLQQRYSQIGNLINKEVGKRL
tara:strand:+ start:2669 stop:3004 length:336 start_codon:yes stop_codon:yes gene_type:complete